MDKSLLKDIQQNHTPKKPRPADYGITIKEYAKSEGISEDMAARSLLELVDLKFLRLEENWTWHGKAAKIFVRADKKPKG